MSEKEIKIAVKDLTKRYGTHVAVDNISFDVCEGEIVGFLGPNGAGKTTTMNILTGFSAPTKGDVFINGFNVIDEPEKAKSHLGYLPDNPPLYGEMLVDEYLQFVCDIKHVKQTNRKAMIDEIKEQVRIKDMGKRLLRNLSKGYRQRVGLAQAMIGNPQVLVLDEPTVGLDPKQILEMRDVIKMLGKKHTVLLSSHILTEVSAVCDRVVIISRGKIVASDTPENLSHSLTKGLKMLVRCKGEKDKIASCLSEISTLQEAKFVSSRENGTYDFEVQGKDKMDIREAVFASCAKNNLPILLFQSTDLTLEDIFLQVTTGEGGKNQ